MKTIILCGGLGTRLGIETKKIPKPMVAIEGKPIVEHIIRTYIKYGFHEFILATGYKSAEIEKYFSKLKIDANIKCVNTGLKLNTGGRILKLKKDINKNENFMLTYGDGLSAQNLSKLYSFHKKNKKISTITVVRPPARFGQVNISKNSIVSNFKEKPKTNLGWINGGFFVLNYKVFKFFKKKNEVFEHGPLERLAKKKELCAFKFEGVWQCMDTPRDKEIIKRLMKKKVFYNAIFF